MDCKVDIPPIQKLNDNELTVGREFYLVCKGVWPKVDLSEARLVLPEADKYKLQLLSAEYRSADEVDLKVVSYVAGPVQVQSPVLQAKEQSIEIGPVQFEVVSVLPTNPEEKVEPYGPVGPLELIWPLWLWVGLVALAAMIATFGGQKLRRWLQRRKLIEEMSAHDSALSALHQLHHTFRKLQREKEIYVGSKIDAATIKEAVQEIRQAFLLFLTREFQVPALTWPLKEVLGSIKRYENTIYLAHAKAITDVVEELDKAVQSDKLILTDAIALMQKSRIVAEKVDQTKNGKGLK